MSKQVSIIVPIYNAQAYLAECLDSLAGQTHTHFIAYLIDNGSTDHSREICERYCGADPRFRLLSCAQRGVSNARNAGLFACRGDDSQYVAFVDADDRAEPDFLEKLIGSGAENRSEIVACSYYDYGYSKKRPPVFWGSTDVCVRGGRESIREFLKNDGFFTSLWNKLFDKAFLFAEENFTLFDETLAFGEDEVWLILMLSKAERVSFVPVPLYHWKCRKNSASRKERLSRDAFSVVYAKLEVRKLAASLQDEELIRMTNCRLLRDCYHLKRMAYCKGKPKMYRFLSRCFKEVYADFMRSELVGNDQRAKVLILDALMALHVPGKVLLLAERMFPTFKKIYHIGSAPVKGLRNLIQGVCKDAKNGSKIHKKPLSV